MTRDEYQVAAATAGVPTWEDARIVDATYALRYADWYLYPNHEEYRLARDRLIGIEVEKAAQRPASTYRPLGRCAHCGYIVIAASLMTSSHGTVCPDCYDLASD